MNNIATLKKMKAAVVHEFKENLAIENIKIPLVGKNDFLVKIKACGVCHTDLHAAHGDWPVKPTLPLIPGHEGVGEIVEVGEGVTHLKAGDRGVFLGCIPLADNVNIA